MSIKPEDDVVSLTRMELDLMLREAGRRGAEEALQKIGLDAPDKIAMFSDMQSTWQLFSEMRRGMIKRLFEYLVVVLVAVVTWWISGGGLARIAGR